MYVCWDHTGRIVMLGLDKFGTKCRPQQGKKLHSLLWQVSKLQKNFPQEEDKSKTNRPVEFPG